MTDLNERTLGVAKEYALCITSEDGKRFCIDYDGSTADSTMTPDEGALIFARCVGPRLAALPRTVPPLPASPETMVERLHDVTATLYAALTGGRNAE